MSSGPSSIGLRLRAQVAAAWCLLAAIELILNAVIPDSAFLTKEFRVRARLAAVCFDLVCLTGALFVTVGAATLIEWMGRHRGGGAPLPALVSGVRPVLLWMLLTAYAASWGEYGVPRQFLDREGIAFWLAQPIQLFYWADRYLVAALPASALLFAWVLGTWLPRQVARRSPRSQRWLVRVVAVLAFVPLLGAVLGELMSDKQRTELMPEPRYFTIRDNHAGPFARAVGDLRRAFSRPTEATAGTDRIGITRRPIVPMTSYLAAIDEKRINRWNVILIVVDTGFANWVRGRDMPAASTITLPSAKRSSGAMATRGGHSSWP